MFIGLLGILTVTLFFSDFDHQTRLLFFVAQLTMIFVFAMGLLILRRGHVTPVALTLLLLSYFGTVYSHAFVFRTIHDPSIIGYLIVIPLAGLFFGTRVMYGAVIAICHDHQCHLYVGTLGVY